MLFSNPLIEVPLIELLKLWGELVEAYHGKHGFGGDTAEIYAYRLQPYHPLAHGRPITENGNEELHLISLRAGNALVALVEEFCNQYDCQATINDIGLDAFFKELNANRFEFDWRVYVKINSRR